MLNRNKTGHPLWYGGSSVAMVESKINLLIELFNFINHKLILERTIWLVPLQRCTIMVTLSITFASRMLCRLVSSCFSKPLKSSKPKPDKCCPNNCLKWFSKLAQMCNYCCLSMNITSNKDLSLWYLKLLHMKNQYPFHS